MGFDLKPEIKQALTKMNFINKFEELSKKYSPEKVSMEDRLLDLDIAAVMKIIENLGYSVSFNKSEKFVRVEEVIQKDLVFGVNIMFPNGRADFIWEVRHNEEVRLGSPWTVYSRLLIDSNYRIQMPAFRDYNELEALLKESFEMYEEFKAILIKEYLG